MSIFWRVYARNESNLRSILNILLSGRETEIIITRGTAISVAFSDLETGNDLARMITETLGNKVEKIQSEHKWKENVFLANKPKYRLFTTFPFLIETILGLNIGDRFS
ncbi:MAG: hypothetical protein QXO03_03435 [Thermoplasmatales archaeon]